LILSGPADECEIFNASIKFWGRQVFGRTGAGLLLVKACRSQKMTGAYGGVRS